MQLIDDWHRLAPRLWSVRLAALAAFLGVVEMALPLFQAEIPPRVFGGLSVAVALASAIARLIQQADLKAEK